MERIPNLDLVHSIKLGGPVFACLTCQRFDVPKDHRCDDVHDSSGRRIAVGTGPKADGPFGQVSR